MSTTANTIPPYVFEQKGVHAGPFTFDVPGSLEVRPDTATARFDGAGASGPFLACLTMLGSDGERLGRWFNPTILQPGDVAEVTYTPPFGSAAVSPTPAGGAGLQFNVGTYGPDNVGDWSLIEATGTVAQPFSQPNGSNTDEESASLGVNAQNGTIFTQDPANAFGGVGAVVAIEQVTGTGAGASCLAVTGKDFTAGAGQVLGIAATVQSAGANDCEAASLFALMDAAATADAYGLQSSAVNNGTGREIAALFSTGGAKAGANSLALLCNDALGNPIFEVRNDGSVHIKTGTAIIADL